ncbi:MAG: hypothetical protein WBB75_14570 [Sphingobacterium siyangense]
MLWIKFVEYLTLLVPLELMGGIILLGRRKQFYQGYNNWLMTYLIISLITDLSARWIGKYYANNLLLVPIYAFFEMLIFTGLYFRYIFTFRHPLLLILTAVTALYITTEIFMLASSSTMEFQSYARTLSAFLLTIFSTTYLIEQMKTKNSAELMMRLNCSILFYFAFSFFIYLPINFFINAATQTKYFLWIVNLFIVCLFYLSIIATIWQSGKAKTP